VAHSIKDQLGRQPVQEDFIIVRIMEPFWLLAGLVMVIPDVLEQERAHGNVPSIGPNRSPKNKSLNIVDTHPTKHYLNGIDNV